MSKSTKDTVVKDIYNQLLEQEKVTSQNDFAEQIKFHPSPVSAMMKGQKPMPYKFLEVLYKKFNVNANYILSNGAGNMFLGQGEIMSKKDVEAIGQMKEKIKTLEKEIVDLKQRLLDKEKIIELLERSKS